jgi:hypothetical protein
MLLSGGFRRIMTTQGIWLIRAIVVTDTVLQRLRIAKSVDISNLEPDTQTRLSPTVRWRRRRPELLTTKSEDGTGYGAPTKYWITGL